MTLREPFGVCAQIIPWNYPAQIFGRCMAAALAAGNCVVLKPAEDPGQTCSAGSRLLVQNEIADELTARLARRFACLRCDAGERDADCGALINARQKARLEAALARAEADGIEVIARGELAGSAPASGHFVTPCLLSRVSADHETVTSELFGPVLVIQTFADEQKAVELANATDFGLCAGVWTRDGGRQFRLSKALRCGQGFVNNYGAAGGVELPFGGVGRSGYGREKGFEGLRGFTRLKTIAVRHG